LDELVDAYDEPFGDSSGLPTYIVSRMAREHVTVALTGDGGDEVFAGYPRFAGFALAERVPGWIWGPARALAARLPHVSDFRSPLRRAQRFLAAAAAPADERMLRWIGYVTDDLAAVLGPELRETLEWDGLLESFREPLAFAAAESPLARVLQLNFETYLPEDLLVKADRCSMAHGLELRSPFLDTALVEWAASLPDRLRIRGRRLKALLKDAFPDLLPEAIRTRGKMGFGIPLPTWLRTRWRGLLEERLLTEEARVWAWLDRGAVLELARRHQQGEADHGHALWALMTLETWLRRRA
ncbi:MAG: asparagine synthetase B, partial [Gemmatimonadetes bacterium]